MDMNKEREAFEEFFNGDYEYIHGECYCYEKNYFFEGKHDKSAYYAFEAWKVCAEAKQAEIDELKAKVEKLEGDQATKQTYLLRDADYVVDDPCEYDLDPLCGEVFEFYKWNRSEEVNVYIVPIFENEDNYELIEFSSEDEADKAAAENKAMIEAAQGEGHE